jgi:hypothetical protein
MNSPDDTSFLETKSRCLRALGPRKTVSWRDKFLAVVMLRYANSQLFADTGELSQRGHARPRSRPCRS